MAQRKPEDKPTLDQVLKLVTQLTPEEQEILIQEFAKLHWLRTKCAEAEASLERGEGIPAEEAFARLEARYRQKKADQ